MELTKHAYHRYLQRVDPSKTPEDIMREFHRSGLAFTPLGNSDSEDTCRWLGKNAIFITKNGHILTVFKAKSTYREVKS